MGTNDHYARRRMHDAHAALCSGALGSFKRDHSQQPCYDFCFLQQKNIARIRLQVRDRSPRPFVSSCLYHYVIGSNDGRCVQMAGTQSVQADDLRILGIPRLRQTVTITGSQHDNVLRDYSILLKTGKPLLIATRSHDQKGSARIFVVSVVRVQPRASEGITDLLSTPGCCNTKTHARCSGPLRSKIATLSGEKPLPYPTHPKACQSATHRPSTLQSRSQTIERWRSRSLPESTRQITPPTTNGHAPLSRKSRKNYQPVHHRPVLIW